MSRKTSPNSQSIKPFAVLAFMPCSGMLLLLTTVEKSLAIFICLILLSHQASISSYRTDTHWMFFGGFSPSLPFCLNTRECAWKSQENSSLWNTQTIPSVTNHHANTMKVIEIMFFPILMFNMNINWRSWRVSSWFYAWSFCCKWADWARVQLFL